MQADAYDHIFFGGNKMKNLTEIVFILDRSGSMSGMEQDTIGGYNAFLQKQKEVEGDALVSTILFSMLCLDRR